MNDVLKMGKKVLTIVAVVATILWSVGAPLVVSAETTVTLNAGDVIQGASTKNVFYYAADGKRYTFPTDKVYYSWYKDWSVVKKVPDAQLGTIAIGGTVAYRPGTQLVKIATDPKVYAVEPNGSLRWIETGDIAKALWGTNWPKLVHDVDPSIFPYVYSISASSINTATYPVGSLVKVGSDYYLIGAGMTKMKVTADGLTANRLQTKFAAVATDLAAYATGADLATVNTMLTTVTGTAVAGGTTPVVGGNVSVSLAATTPAAGSAASTAIRVPFTTLNLTAGSADAVVKNLVVERQGVAADGAFSSIMLIDAADQSRVGLDQTLNSLHQVTFNDEITIKAGTTKTIVIAGNMNTVASGHAGEMPKLALVGLTVNNNGSVTGLPVVGNAMTVITTLSLGTLNVARGSNDPGQAVTDKPLGTTGYIFSGLKLTAGSNEDMQVDSVRFYQAGSASATDLSNVKVNFDGVDYPTTLSADGKYYTANFNGVSLLKGITKEMYIKADVMTGSSRTVRFDVYRKTDLAVKGKSYGYYASPTGTSDTTNTSPAAGTFCSANPWYQGYLVTMAAGGNLRVDKGNLAAANVSKGSTGVVLGGFNFVVEGEAVKATQIVLNIDLTGTGSSSDVTNITLVDAAGNVVAGPVDGIDTGTTQDGTATFSTTVTFPTGTNAYTVKGNLNNDLVGNDTIRVGFDTPTSKFSAVGGGTGNTVTVLPGTAVYSNYQTVKGGSLVVSVSPVPVAQTVVKGATDVTLANYVFDASASGEDIKVTSFKPLLTVDGVSKQTDVVSVRVYGFDGTTDGVQLNTGSNVINPAANSGAVTDQTVITLDKPLYIPKGSSKTLVLKANISSSAQSATVLYGITAMSTTYINATGKDTGTTPTITGSTVTGQTMNIATSGQYSIALDSGRPQGSLLAAGSTGVTVNKLRFTGTTEPIAITKLRLKLSNYSASTSDQDVVKVYAYDETGKLVSDGYFTSGVANLTIPTAVAGAYNPFIIPKDDERVLTIKLDLGTITTTASVATAGHSITVDYDYNASDLTLNQGIAQNSGVTVPAFSADTDNTANVSYMFRSVPTVNKLSVSSSILANGSGVPLYRFKVTADPKGDVDLYKFTFKVSTTSGSTGTTNVSNLTLVDVTESSEVTLYASTVAPTAGAQYDVVLLASPGTPASSAVTPRTVSAGSYRIFELRADVSGVSTGSSIVSQLEGDSTVVSHAAGTFMAIAATTDADTNNDFIWSDKSKSSHGTGTADWTNGFLVAGLPSSNLATEVLSK